MGPTDHFETEARRRGYRWVAGLDEAGRGPLAGPVVAAAVILPARVRLAGLDDSKQLTASERDVLYDVIQQRALAIGIGSASEQEIDALNILVATCLAMKRAVEAVAPPPDFLLTDAVTVPCPGIPQRPIIKGDGLSVSIAAASIIAKVTRDRLMVELHLTYPQYNFLAHKGYGTEEHLRRLAEHGPCTIHRRSFRPVQECLAQAAQLPAIAGQ